MLDYHLSMLHDTARMDAFRRAIDASVQPGDVVVDIGCGSGVLSFMACEAGARKVYAIEGGPVIEVARELAIDNGFADRIEFLGGWSIEVGIPEPADVLISETIGNAGLDEGIVAWTFDARQRLLRPGAVLLPQRLRVWVAAAESFDEHAVVSDWRAAGSSVRLRIGPPPGGTDAVVRRPHAEQPPRPAGARRRHRPEDRSQRDDHVRGPPPGGP